MMRTFWARITPEKEIPVNDLVPGPDIHADEKQNINGEGFVFVSSDASRHQVVSAHTEKVGKNLKIKKGAR